jgi:predicted RNA-binding protein (virulence factor B family)
MRQNKTMKLGEINRLKIDEISDFGLYLVSEEDEYSVLLPNAYVDESMQVGHEIDVFLYTDSEDRLVATTLTPLIKIDEFAILEVKDLTKFGAFMDMGLPKDLLVPRNHQHGNYQIGDKKIIRCIKDENTQRLIGVESYKEFIQKCSNCLGINQDVSIMIFAKTPLGYKVIIENTYEGLIYENEIFQRVKIGDMLRGFVSKIRDDGKLDISLQKIGVQHGQTNSKKVLDIISKTGSTNITSKSTPAQISSIFGLSKKAYKASLTKLKNDGKITEKDALITII